MITYYTFVQYNTVQNTIIFKTLSVIDWRKFGTKLSHPKVAACEILIFKIAPTEAQQWQTKPAGNKRKCDHGI